MRYQVKAVKSDGGVVSLSLDARDNRDANEQARAQGYMVLAVRPARSLPLPQSFGSTRFPLVLFTRDDVRDAALTALAAVFILEMIGGVERFTRGNHMTAAFNSIQELKVGEYTNAKRFPFNELVTHSFPLAGPARRLPERTQFH
jgi:type II secretory pathway component PulF